MEDKEVLDFWIRLDMALKFSKKGTLKDVCREAGVPYQTVVNQKCQKKYPSVKALMKLCKILNCQLDWLVMGVEESANELFKGNPPTRVLRVEY